MCTIEENKENIKNIINRIDENWQEIDSLLDHEISSSTEINKGYFMSFIDLSHVFGAVDIKKEQEKIFVRLNSEFGKYFMNCLFDCIINKIYIIDTMDREAGTDCLASLPNFLKLFEKRRIEKIGLENASPIRESNASKCIIKAKLKDGEPRFLLYLDKYSLDRYKLIGGREKPQDSGDPKKIMLREIQEELNFLKLRWKDDIALDTLRENVSYEETSYAYGVKTFYNISFYHILFKDYVDIPKHPSIRWFTKEELLRGESSEKWLERSSKYFKFIDEHVTKSGLDRLQPSFPRKELTEDYLS